MNKVCQNCGELLNQIVFTHKMSEEWSWNGSAWECTGRSSLTDDPDSQVFCPNCDTIIGTGKDFGF